MGIKLDTSFSDIKKMYDSMDAWGLHTLINLHQCDPEIIRDENKIREYVDRLCDLIKMKKYGECIVVDFGEDEKVAGFSMTQLIETSLISGHFANKSNSSYIDIFSCKLYDPKKAVEFSKDFFGGKDFNVEIVLRK